MSAHRLRKSCVFRVALLAVAIAVAIAVCLYISTARWPSPGYWLAMTFVFAVVVMPRCLRSHRG